MAIKKTYEVQTLTGVIWETRLVRDTEKAARAAVELLERTWPGQQHRYQTILSR